MARELGALNEVRKPAKFAHFVLRTRNLDAMKRWYSTLLGARVVFENQFIAFLTYDDEHHRVALVGNPQFAERPGHAVGLDHVAYTLGSLEDLLHTYLRLKHECITPTWCVNHGPTTSMYYQDPDGNRVEFQVDNFPSVEELHAWFRSGEFEKNPIGVNFDPDQLLERWRAGESTEQLVQRAGA
jgi:catechol-2,3-dioxygenase